MAAFPLPQAGEGAHLHWARSNIRGEVGQLVEQDAAPGEHLLDFVSGIADRAAGSIERQFSRLWRLVIIADPGKSGERAGAGLGVMALGVAALADLGRGC